MQVQQVQGRLAAIMAADVSGFSRSVALNEVVQCDGAT